jgi:uncharacterized protein YbjT (DUF2867 family)
MTSPILISGALGNVGAEIVKSLQAAGQPVRPADFRLEALHTRYPGLDNVRLDFSDPATFAPALKGVTRLFLMRPPAISDVKRYLFPFIDTAQQMGVQQIAFLSLVGVEQNTITPHYKVEQYLRAQDIGFTFLRASFFMQNLSSTHRAEIRARDEIYLPVGRARTSFVDVRDLGAAGAACLSQPGHVGQAYELTGPEALDYYQVAALFTEVLGRKITYHDAPLPLFAWRTVANGTPLMMALVMSFLYAATRNGMAAKITDTLPTLIGRSAITMRQFIADYRECWAKPDA